MGVMLDVVGHLLAASNKTPQLCFVKRNCHILDGTHVLVFGLASVGSDNVVVEGDLTHTEFDFGWFDLDASAVQCAD